MMRSLRLHAPGRAALPRHRRPGPGPEPAEVKPEQVGLSSERLGRITAMLKADADKGTIPGAILLVARHGKIAAFDTVGVRDPGSKAPMTKDAIFRIYSMSKPITSVATMILFEEGKLALADPVAKYIPAARRAEGRRREGGCRAAARPPSSWWRPGVP